MHSNGCGKLKEHNGGKPSGGRVESDAIVFGNALGLCIRSVSEDSWVIANNRNGVFI